MKKIAKEMLEERGVTIKDMAELVIELQKNYVSLTLEEAMFNIEKVLQKREVQNAILTGIQLDKLAEKDLLEEPLLSIVKKDESLYGIDEIVALSITNIYGSIGFTNFGYLDKLKPGIIGKINAHEHGQVNTFLDDLVAGIIAAACSRIAHAAESSEGGED
ncbi:MAG: phosphatidylglycerophosphatase A [Clostridiaceae bacterium]|nr:phosphatidylglycerophosphatase A [Clostridiaceae bacterium]